MKLREDILNSLRQYLDNMAYHTNGFTLLDIFNDFKETNDIDISLEYFRKFFRQAAKLEHRMEYDRTQSLWFYCDCNADVDDELDELEKEYENMDIPDEEDTDILEHASLKGLEDETEEEHALDVVVNTALKEYFKNNSETFIKQTEHMVKDVMYQVVSDTWKQKVIPAVTKNMEVYCKKLIETKIKDIIERLDKLETGDSKTDFLISSLEDLIDKCK